MCCFATAAKVIWFHRIMMFKASSFWWRECKWLKEELLDVLDTKYDTPLRILEMCCHHAGTWHAFCQHLEQPIPRRAPGSAGICLCSEWSFGRFWCWAVLGVLGDMLRAVLNFPDLKGALLGAKVDQSQGFPLDYPIEKKLRTHRSWSCQPAMCWRPLDPRYCVILFETWKPRTVLIAGGDTMGI